MDVVFHNPGNLKHRSDVAVHNGIAYVAGALASDLTADIISQTGEVLTQLEARLADAGTDKSNVLSATIWLADLNDIDAVNEVWKLWVTPGRIPARACVQAGLQHCAKIEIALIAAVP